ncbi:MAG: hypothetical protein WDO70_01175 [Alphaproteobacteria bacterium]
MTDSQGRYIHLDGAPYGSTGPMHILGAPSVKMGVPIAIAFAAAKAMCAPPGTGKWVFAADVASGVICPFFLLSAMNRWPKRDARMPATAVIDTSGRTANDPSALVKMIREYKIQAFVFGAAGAVFGAGAGLASADQFLMMRQAVQVLANATWSWRAARKLETGAWTVQTEPPKIEEKKEEKSSLADLVRPPVSGAAIRALPRPAQG